ERPLNVGRNTNQNDKFQMLDENDERPLNVGRNNTPNYNDKFQMMDENDERPIKPMFKNNFDDDPIPALKNKITPQDLEEDIINEFPNNINEEPFEEEVKEEPPKEKKSSKQTVLKDDPKFDIIKEILGPEITNSLDSQKWEEKKEGLESIYQFLSDNETNLPFRGEDLFDYLKFKLKNFKETNFNLVKEALNIFSYLIQNKLISNDLGTLVLNTYYEKLSDIKLKEQTMQFILAFIDSTDPNSVLKNVISKLKRKSNPKLLMEYGTLFEKIIEDFNISELPIFELVDICKTMAANANPKVRTSATTLLCALYKYIGPDLKNMIKDIKESTRKNIEAELDKIIVETAPPSKQTKKSMNIKIENENTNGSNDNNKPINLELIPRVDISKKINQNLIKAINDGKWQEKKEAADAIEKILNDANNKILPNGLNNYFNMIKNKLGDGGKNVVRMAISLLSKSIDALGVGFKQYSKPLAMALVPNLSDKMPILREDCQNCMDKWVNNIGINDLINVLPQFLKTDNIEIRTEIFKFLTKNKDKIGKGNEYFFSENVLPLLYCLQDKSSNVRNSAETQIIYSLKYINLSKYTESLSEFKPAIQNDLLLVLNRLANMEEEEDDEEENITPEINNVNNGATGNEKEEIKIEEKKIQPHQQLKVIKKNKLQASEENLNGGNNKNNSNNKLGTVNNQGET
ncbi:MAG: hypothetical protein MJ252_27060, partial [archaeon]|nr:hypothetical protein [archaeon]